MNTATYREQARQAAKELRWQDAAELYGMAIAAYPIFAPNGDCLSSRDVAALEAKRSDCLRMWAAS